MTKNFILIGTFDGVHKGHQHLTNKLKALAKKYEQKSLALYFAYPAKVLQSVNKEMSVICTPEEKKQLLKAQNIDGVKELKFFAIKNLSRENFFNLLLTKYKMGGMLVGRDFAFAKNRSGHLDFLAEKCKQYDIPFIHEGFVTNSDGKKISSSLIRDALNSGHLIKANRMLTRPYEISGKVIMGMKLGRKIGFPTANLDPSIFKIHPKGVYAGKAILDDKTYNAVINIGFRPTINTINKNVPLIEAHLLNFDKDIYGKVLKLQFLKKIRKEMRFHNLDELKAQIAKDKAKAKAFLDK
ncbi:MAG: riboflavin biosynthesis protein RibF [Elusimicrobiaceae bacterium]|jgi:riboflavin kinase / FMN adenylyltransferase|nr:riboflavin biosynthesis protein RibF [Elusimicrobiaceae bacterium]MBT3954597.1 riboflavin biosynthesis protein RibF [Elusimicrobiaceae bacterium]MBT4007905.1 riboflavin biosynthesis protein RibF [Elusimicrobiaceae bacterium]MBT4403122.1 riboflavin biosynthesis protein RibF [Elusimicrobiaceae bacterium]MBT4439919.1 riboflavin biosynthesis protein RibF [Elusimicrobiaceae bacterium]